MAPILDDRSLEFISRSPEQTRRLGARLGQLLQGGEVICLEGSLGAGKTVIAQGIGRGWGAVGRLVSPSFVLVREHRRPTGHQRLLHADFYRLEQAQEVWGLGLQEWMEDPAVVVLIEWPERAPEVLPQERLWIRLEFAEETRRRLLFTAEGASYLALLRAFRRAAFGV
ncbi:MAG TPA: tRNA (adenosine(37)-N6)-threonylcarbamoyltransferase complex ATPase subunit type 1 TsaE [Anaerolineales bacterium]|nr:tRNA (adenosine(37)-N6)-threonylcarbamoyltransferase complex ATPase subunit type 1 TsaE [Anaerolineae bacterium]HIQ01471.1 tRNA (adenosine(37)-N6)-threonylcarbamoyltransferase complex ATPase subunit type 1 TsaE [Anaerolineales bacterium]